MKARATAFLNLRTSTPEILPDNNTGDKFYSPGDVIDVAEVIIGQNYKNNNIWYRLADGGFVWSGGTDLDSSAQFIANTAFANVANNLSKELLLNKPAVGNGKGIVIGVLDCGVDTRHPSLKSALLSEESFLGGLQPGEIKRNHGTCVSGILVGNEQTIIGLAIDAKIRSYRVADNSGNTDNAAVKRALESIVKNNPEIDILNLSFDISMSFVPLIQKVVDLLTAKGVIVVVAGFSADLETVSNIAMLKNVISVGIYEDKNFGDIQTSGLPREYKIAFRNTAIHSTGLHDTDEGNAMIDSSSAYTAVTSGLIAKFLSENFVAKLTRLTEVNKFLKEISFVTKQENNITSFKPLRNENI